MRTRIGVRPGSDRGQTGVRPGSDQGQTRVIPGSDDGREIIAFASTSEYRPRECYAGVAEFSVYVARSARRAGAGRLAMERLIEEAQHAGFWKLVSRVFPENQASRTLLQRVGFREVGIYHRHGKLGDTWRDTVIVERLLS